MMHPSNKMTTENLDDVFSYHSDVSKNIRYEKVRESAKIFAKIILEQCLDCYDTHVALMCVRQAVMFANAAIALEPLEQVEETK